MTDDAIPDQGFALVGCLAPISTRERQHDRFGKYHSESHGNLGRQPGNGPGDEINNQAAPIPALLATRLVRRWAPDKPNDAVSRSAFRCIGLRLLDAAPRLMLDR